MTERQEKLLRAIVDEYVRTAEPVGSALFAGNKEFPVSPATIRKEMVALEEAGLIMQPHTSAGRVPTELGFRYMVEHFLEEKPMPREKIAKLLLELKAHEEEPVLFMKRLVKMLAELSKQTMMVALAEGDVYYTGIANLFQHPEFRAAGRVTTLSTVVDRFDEIVGELWRKKGKVAVLLGTECPFGEDCSAIVAPVRVAKQERLLVMLGPLRMDYDRNVALLKQTVGLLDALAP